MPLISRLVFMFLLLLGFSGKKAIFQQSSAISLLICRGVLCVGARLFMRILNVNIVLFCGFLFYSLAI
jgi:hypothetical protein